MNEGVLLFLKVICYIGIAIIAKLSYSVVVFVLGFNLLLS